MISKWFELKEKAIRLRKDGCSIRFIETHLGIPRSTLSGWFKTISLTDHQKNRLRDNWLFALQKARKKASLWHQNQKKRLRIAATAAADTLKRIGTPKLHILELALAMLYLGEGFKKDTTALGNSDPIILKFFLAIIRDIYHLDQKKITGELHLRADQNPEEMKKYWSKELHIPIENFKSIRIDTMTSGSKTYPSYKGVCVLRCGNVAIQRKLLFLANLFCNKVIDAWARSSVG